MKKAMKRAKRQTRKYSGGGYVIEEKIAPGITFWEMNGKGFAAEFGKITKAKKRND